MKDEKKTKKQLIEELETERQKSAGVDVSGVGVERPTGTGGEFPHDGFVGLASAQGRNYHLNPL